MMTTGTTIVTETAVATTSVSRTTGGTTVGMDQAHTMEGIAIEGMVETDVPRGIMIVTEIGITIVAADAADRGVAAGVGVTTVGAVAGVILATDTVVVVAAVILAIDTAHVVVTIVGLLAILDEAHPTGILRLRRLTVSPSLPWHRCSSPNLPSLHVLRT